MRSTLKAAATICVLTLSCIVFANHPEHDEVTVSSNETESTAPLQSAAEVYLQTLEQGGTEEEAAAAMRRTFIEQRLAENKSPANVYWTTLELGATEKEALAAMRDSIASERLATAESPAEVYWAMLDNGASDEDATAAMRSASILERMESASPAEMYWLMLESGATEEESIAAMRNANIARRLQSATPAEIYWLMLQEGKSEAEAAQARDSAVQSIVLQSAYTPERVEGLLIGRDFEPTVAAEMARSAPLAARLLAGDSIDDLVLELTRVGKTPSETNSLINAALEIVDFYPQLQALTTTCLVYSGKVIYCDNEGEPVMEIVEVAANCWSSFLSQCHLQTCPAGEKLYRSITIDGGCQPQFPSNDTCAHLAVSGTAYWSPNCDDRLLCRCILEKECEDIESQCCDETLGCEHCPECD